VKPCVSSVAIETGALFQTHASHESEFYAPVFFALAEVLMLAVPLYLFAIKFTLIDTNPIRLIK